MRIQILSDLHLEIESYRFASADADVVVLAGDIHNKLKGIEWIKEQGITVPVIYVPGNHEFYGATYQKLIRQMTAAAEGSNIHVLAERAVDIEGIRFHGTTLWTDFSLFGTPEFTGAACQQVMNDYRFIRREPTYSKMRSVDIFHIHKRAIAWLAESLESSPNDKNVVVTHHAPSALSLDVGDRDKAIGAAYASDLHGFLEKYRPTWWIHGHVHSSLDYLIADTRVICNAKGHKRRLNFSFKSEFTIEL